ncbi:hypothetical protein UFOVP319_57 [uncultured Caudovirales phage]|uniref:Uncharacterized protein n=1 Tax=uncultured Caudovirales phage TaxID=2100421 RepID=A0A6J5LT09_9CAUD|nr:hypothetical protein UFOVP319_57 [uncultured Caudovirales phage]
MKHPELPRDYIKRLIRSVTDDAAIAEMCQARFGNQVTPERVAELRREVKR